MQLVRVSKKAIVTACSFALILGACGEDDEPPPRYPFTFSATVDNQPLEGVSITVNEQVAGTTNGEGLLQQDLTGPEGAPVSVGAQCPEGYTLRGETQVHTLRRVISLDPATSQRGIQVQFACAPEHRDAVVIVRAADRVGLPVELDGREVGRTDANGVAHVHVRMAPQTSFQLRIATASNERLRPQNPSRSFTVPDRDEVFVFDQPFEEEAPPRRRIRRATPRSTAVRLPIRIGGGN
jgi:hypothetical protein